MQDAPKKENHIEMDICMLTSHASSHPVAGRKLSCSGIMVHKFSSNFFIQNFFKITKFEAESFPLGEI